MFFLDKIHAKITAFVTYDNSDNIAQLAVKGWLRTFAIFKIKFQMGTGLHDRLLQFGSEISFWFHIQLAEILNHLNKMLEVFYQVILSINLSVR